MPKKYIFYIRIETFLLNAFALKTVYNNTTEIKKIISFL